jgi:hypothetical protein
MPVFAERFVREASSNIRDRVTASVTTTMLS